jgi:hypothetical protein
MCYASLEKEGRGSTEHKLLLNSEHIPESVKECFNKGNACARHEKRLPEQNEKFSNEKMNHQDRQAGRQARGSVF